MSMQTGVSRRGFMGGLSGAGAIFAAGGVGVPSGMDLGEERMRFGVLADIHIATRAQQPYFERTLRKFDEWKVDGVVACGDLADYAMELELQLLADTWFKVFPDGRGSDGRPVANLMHYGDHDMQDDRYINFKDAVKEWPDEKIRRDSVMFTHDRKASWERCFKEPWSPIAVKEVKGYTFVLSHFTRGEPDNRVGNNVPGLEAAMAGLKLDPKKPVFYSQHRIPRNTACGPLVWGQDDGSVTKILSGYPNAVAFCGHCHMGGAYEKSIWQGAFTCVQVPSLRYCVTMQGRENGYSLKDRPRVVPANPSKCMGSIGSGECHQGLLCIVHDNAMVIRRWEFTHDKPVGPDWVVPISSFALPPHKRPFAFANREKVVGVAEFSARAKVTVGKPVKGKKRDKSEHMMTPVSFPPAIPAKDGFRANDYEVSLELRHGEVERVLLQKRVYSPMYHRGTEMDVKPVTCMFAADEIPAGWELRFTVRPVNAFGRKGNPISSDWRKFS